MLLKKWKQAWKKEDGFGHKGSRHHDRSHHNHNIRRKSELSSTSEYYNNERPYPRFSTKATRTFDDVDNDDPSEDASRPTKRQKVEDAIRSHLPEIMDIDNINEDVEPTPEEVENFIKSLLVQAKVENTLAILEPESQKIKVSCDLLSWACNNERDRPSESRRKRCALLIVDDVATANARSIQLVDFIEAPVGLYTTSEHSTSMRSWSDLVGKNDVIIVTANLLHESLAQNSLSLSQIHYIVFDDVLTVKDHEAHPIRQIMMFYHIVDRANRPKVSGFIVPPDNSKLVFDTSLLKLEHVLDSRYYGINDITRESILSLPEKPMELVVYYDPQVQIIETPLLKRLQQLDSHKVAFRSYFRNAKHALVEIGACACDLLWRRALKEMDDESACDAPVYEEEDELPDGSEAAIRKVKSNIRETIRNWSFAMPKLDQSARGFNVTPKFAKLLQILQSCRPQGDTFRGIIFVQKRSLAYILTDLLRNLGDQISFLRPMHLVGHKLSSDPSNQEEILEAFKNGVFNLLVATKYAEDLDICPVSIVIRFDLFESQTSYAFCRARARGQECHLIHMAERGSDVHRRILSQITQMDSKLERWVQRVSLSPNGSLPPCRLQEALDPYRSDSDDEEEGKGDYLQDPTTNGRIYVQDATKVVYRFVSQLQLKSTDGDSEEVKPLFEFEELQGDPTSKSMYICTVILPENAPFHRASGKPCASKAYARRSACYQTCLELYNRGVLDYRFFPRPPLPSTRPQRAAYISTQMVEELSDREEEELYLPAKTQHGQGRVPGVRPYPRKQPDYWRNSLQILRDRVYPTIVVPILDPFVANPGDYSPMVIITRLPLPPLAPMTIFVNGIAGKVHFKRAESFEADKERLDDLHRYTIRVVRTVTNKPFVCAFEKIAYFLAPLPRDFKIDLSDDGKDDGQRWVFPSVVEHIPWDQVKIAATKAVINLNTQDLQTLIKDTDDGMIQDRWAEFTRRYFCVQMRPDLTPLSKPEDSPREKDHENLLAYCIERKKAGFQELQNINQPIIEVSICPVVHGHLNPLSKPYSENPSSKQKTAKYLIPELCAKCTLPASIYRTGSLLPSIISKMDDILLIKELNAKFFDHSISEGFLHAAVTSPAATAEFDYERLELLGDGYLKYLSSIYLFVTFPTLPEGALHVSRQRIISNRSLLRNANRCGLPQYVQSKPFSAKTWAPPNFFIYRPPRVRKTRIRLKKPEEGEVVEGDINLEERLIEEPRKTELKGVGDIKIPNEAELDNLENQDREGSPMDEDDNNEYDCQPENGTTPKKNKRKILKEDHGIQWLGDKSVADVAEAIIGAAYVTGGREIALKATKALNVPVPHIDRWSDFGRKMLAPPPEVTASVRPGTIKAVEKIIGHEFQHPHLLAQALTHSSFQGHEMTCYERLEFIGDAILDFLVIRHIFDRDKTLSPGALTILKAAMVSNSALAAICVWSGLHEHLLFESLGLELNIHSYIRILIEKQETEVREAAREGRRLGQYWVDIEPPKALSDVIESILGALYVSDSFSPVGAETFYDRVLAPFYNQFITLDSLSHHPTKVLFEYFQSQGCQNFELQKQLIRTERKHSQQYESKIIIHDIVLSKALDITAATSARKASDMALNVIQKDPQFMARTCGCREQTNAKRAERKAQKAAAATKGAEEAEEQMVESVLMDIETLH